MTNHLASFQFYANRIFRDLTIKPLGPFPESGHSANNRTENKTKQNKMDLLNSMSTNFDKLTLRSAAKILAYMS